MIVVGIDPGWEGGIAMVKGVRGQRPKLIKAMRMPTIGADAKRGVDALSVIHFIQDTPPDFAFIERAQLMRGVNVSAGAVYMRGVGHLEACLMGLEIPWERMEVMTWKRAHGLQKQKGTEPKKSEIKERSRQKALMLFPEAHEYIKRKDDDGVAEAILIAQCGLQLKW